MEENKKMKDSFEVIKDLEQQKVDIRQELFDIRDKRKECFPYIKQQSQAIKDLVVYMSIHNLADNIEAIRNEALLLYDYIHNLDEFIFDREERIKNILDRK